jgi:5'-nucleotidase
VVDRIRGFRLPHEGFLNVNIPNIQRKNVRGYMVTKLGKRIYNGKVVERTDPRGGKYYWIGGDSDNFEPLEGTDLLAVSQGFVSITPLHWDMTTHQAIKDVREVF